MPHPELDVKCEKKILVESLSSKTKINLEKKIDSFLLLLKNPNDFFIHAADTFPHMKTMKKSMIIASPHPFLILANFFPASKKR